MLNKHESSTNRILNKFSMYEICVNLTCIYRTQNLVTWRFDLDRFHCIYIAEGYPISTGNQHVKKMWPSHIASCCKEF